MLQKSLISILLIGYVTAMHAQGFTVKQFTADYYLNADGYFDVVEKYDVEFAESKHGLYRDINTNYQIHHESEGSIDRIIQIDHIEVPQQHFETNELFGYLWDKKLRIKIGDRNQWVSGQQQYIIKYRVHNAFLATDSTIQFYWNVKAPEWQALFKQINFTVHLPSNTKLNKYNCVVYAGAIGDSTRSDQFEYTYTPNRFTAFSKVNFFSYQNQSVTVLIELPKQLISFTATSIPFWRKQSAIWIFIALLLVPILFLLITIRVKRITPITSYYPPENINPAIAGALIDMKANQRDISCLLPYWASQGIIRMDEIAKGDRSLFNDVVFTKLKELPADVPGYEYNLFHKLFAYFPVATASTARGAFNDALALLNQKAKDYYPNRFTYLKITVSILSVLWAFFSITALPFLISDYINIDSRTFIAFVIINFIYFFILFPFLFSSIINHLRGYNNRGKTIMPPLLGFYHFVKSADVKRIQTLLQSDPNYFEKTMPYAVAFGLLPEWASKFDGLFLNPPQWYVSSNGKPFTNFRSFSSSFKASLSTAQVYMLTTPSRSGSGSSRSSSSSSGSSGGGFGGGGGGSW